jgi:hypothetical protein
MIRPLRGRLGVLRIDGGLAMQTRRVVVTRRTRHGRGRYPPLPEGHTLTKRVWVMVWQVCAAACVAATAPARMTTVIAIDLRVMVGFLLCVGFTVGVVIEEPSQICSDAGHRPRLQSGGKPFAGNCLSPYAHHRCLRHR